MKFRREAALKNVAKGETSGSGDKPDRASEMRQRLSPLRSAGILPA
jgi:hypothetical protein